MLDLFKKDGICEWCINRVIKGENNEQKVEKNGTQFPYFKALKTCYLCKGIIQKIVRKIPIIKQEAEKYEFNTFNVVIQFLNCFEEADQFFIEKNFSPICLDKAIAREFKNLLAKKLEKPFANQYDLLVAIQISQSGQKIEIRVKSLPIFIYGKYQKLTRKIPQSRWPCKACNGLKCKECHYTGLKYQSSVESLISIPFIKFTSATSSKFHGAGREDIDVLMLGNGRPFIIELKNPLTRKIDLQAIRAEVNKATDIKIDSLSLTDRKNVKYLKQVCSLATKTYQASIKCENLITHANLSKLRKYSFPIILRQKTPIRVLHRRADIVRIKKIQNIKIITTSEKKLELQITADGGTYIKEFISGDNGRTVPSLFTILETKCECEYLNVIAIAEVKNE